MAVLPKDFESKPLSDLLVAQQELAEIIDRRREEAIVEARKNIERMADELGISPKQLLNGAAGSRRRKEEAEAS